jgi:rhodanese-related sulfurtransferase
METITADELKQRVENDEGAVVNVLRPEDYAEEHIPNSSNIPMPEAEERFPEEFEMDDDIVVYCADAECSASPDVAETLESLGFENVKDYEEGLAGWKAQGYETESAS